MKRRIDVDTLKESVDLAELIESDLGPPKYRGWQSKWKWICPFHPDTDPSFTVDRNEQYAYCYGCREHIGDVIAWVMKYHKLGFLDACDWLKRNAGATVKNQVVTATPQPRPTHRRYVPQILPPPRQWQRRGRDLFVQCQETLFSEKGARAREYLHSRGLTDETMRTAGLGYNPVIQPAESSDWGLRGYQRFFIGEGIVIPWIADGGLWRIGIRHLDHPERKYTILKGSRSGLYNVDSCSSDKPVAIVEGEFDALTIQQEAGDLVTPIATGGAANGRNTPWEDKLFSTIALLAFDADSAGEDAAHNWYSAFSSAVRCRPWSDDANAMLQEGMDIREWIEEGMTKF